MWGVLQPSTDRVPILVHEKHSASWRQKCPTTGPAHSFAHMGGLSVLGGKCGISALCTVVEPQQCYSLYAPRLTAHCATLQTVPAPDGEHRSALRHPATIRTSVMEGGRYGTRAQELLQYCQQGSMPLHPRSTPVCSGAPLCRATGLAWIGPPAHRASSNSMSLQCPCPKSCTMHLVEQGLRNVPRRGELER